MLKWSEQSLIDRLQCVRVNGYYSNFIAVLSGVPQGYVLGLILFLIFINDICDAIRDCSVKLFADDIKIPRMPKIWVFSFTRNLHLNHHILTFM